MSQEENNTTEKIVPLFEDLNGHTQDDSSFEKAIAKQKETAKKLAETKESINK